MRKILLLGTMLGVAGTALAFGGVFNHGSKSSTYKGGVDAIGVHFGGEKKTADSQSGKDCGTGTSCGEGCCYDGNICKQDPDSGELQCYNEELDWYCNVNESAYPAYGGTPGCCADTIYCQGTDVDGSCSSNTTYGCCDGEIYCIGRRQDGSCYYQGCCSFSGHLTHINNQDVCCYEGKIALCDSEGKECGCCPEGSTSFSDKRWPMCQ